MSKTFEKSQAATAEIRKGPHGWVQWKGTNVCMDVYCPCGAHGHVDDDFAYFVRCHGCGQHYVVSGDVALVPVTREEIDVEKVHYGAIKETEDNAPHDPVQVAFDAIKRHLWRMSAEDRVKVAALLPAEIWRKV